MIYKTLQKEWTKTDHKAICWLGGDISHDMVLLGCRRDILQPIVYTFNPQDLRQHRHLR